MPSSATAAHRFGTAIAPALGVVAVGVLALVALFLPEARAAVSTWNNSTAYGHCYLVLPMALYLAWDRRASLAGLVARPEPALALLAVPVAAAWLVAERLGIMEGRQLMAVAAVEVLILAVLGRTAFSALMGPLLYLVFLVPFGEFLTPFLQHFTARFAVAGLNLLHIPNVSDDLTIEVPAGTFYVAEACAGLRFLIAAIAFGVFYALLNYRSPGRRIAFIAASIIIPVVANGFRALGIVVLGQILGSAEAAAADHLIYGWIFFSIVLLLLVMAGLPLREAPLARGPAPIHGYEVPASLALWSALLTCVLVASGPAVSRVLDGHATPAPFASLPRFVLPEGCVQPEPQPVLPATRAVFGLTCDGQALQIAMETFPARSTASAITTQRRLLTGESGAEEAEVTRLPTPEGNWLLVNTIQPFRTTAVASWVDGTPSQGGLTGRLRQARNSIEGGTHAVVLMTVTAASDHRPPPERQRALMALLQRWVQAQAGLTPQIESIARAAAGS